MSTSLLLICKSVFDIIHTFLFGFVPVCPLLAPQCIVKAIMDHLYWNSWSLFMHDLCACPSPLSVLHLCHISLPPSSSRSKFPSCMSSVPLKVSSCWKVSPAGVARGQRSVLLFCKAPSDNLDCNRLFISWMEVSYTIWRGFSHHQRLASNAIPQTFLLIYYNICVHERAVFFRSCLENQKRKNKI